MILPPKNTEQECLSYAFTYNVLNVYCKGSLYCSLHLYLTLLWCWMTDIEHNILTHHFSSLSICRSASLKYTGEWDGSFPISKSQKAIRKGLERKIRRKQHRNDWEKDTWTTKSCMCSIHVVPTASGALTFFATYETILAIPVCSLLNTLQADSPCSTYQPVHTTSVYLSGVSAICVCISLSNPRQRPQWGNSPFIHVIWHTFVRMLDTISLVTSSINRLTKQHDSRHKLKST